MPCISPKFGVPCACCAPQYFSPMPMGEPEHVRAARERKIQLVMTAGRIAAGLLAHPVFAGHVSVNAEARREVIDTAVLMAEELMKRVEDAMAVPEPIES